jgi:hypothetical protein
MVKGKKNTKQTTLEKKKIRIAKKKTSKRRARGPRGFSSTEGYKLGRAAVARGLEDMIYQGKNKKKLSHFDKKGYHKDKQRPAKNTRKGLKKTLITAAALAASGYGVYKNTPIRVTHQSLPQGTYWPSLPQGEYSDPSSLPQGIYWNPPLMNYESLKKRDFLTGGKRKKKTKKKKTKN